MAMITIMTTNISIGAWFDKLKHLKLIDDFIALLVENIVDNRSICNEYALFFLYFFPK